MGGRRHDPQGQRRNLAGGQSAAKRAPLPEPSSSHIAPWESNGPPTLSTQDLTSGNFFDSGPNNFRLSPNFASDTGRLGSISPSEQVTYSDERRPSQASEATVSSQNSIPKQYEHRNAPHKKLAGFFGEERRHSSRSSEINIPPGLPREHTQSSNQGSIQSNHTEGTLNSNGSSSPQNSQPSSEVTPWMFQEFKVSYLASYKPYFLKP